MAQEPASPDGQQGLDWEKARWESCTAPEAARRGSSLRGIAALDRRRCWIAGSEGYWARTEDGGRTWLTSAIPSARKLDFRGVVAFDDRHALLMASGPGSASRIYRTMDGGQSWSECYRGHRSEEFLDGLAFWDPQDGIAFGDPVDGRFQILTTSDGGAHWERLPSQVLPPALPGEHAFAAGNRALVVHGEGHAWFGTGGSAARVFHTPDRGRSWEVQLTPVRNGSAGQGIFALAFADYWHGVAVGGDDREEGAGVLAAAWTADGGKDWKIVQDSPPSGFRSAVVFLPGGSGGRRLLAAGPQGCDLSADGGLHWQPFSADGFHCLSRAADGTLWAAGAEGRVARLLP